MKKRLTLLFAAVLLALPLGATVAMADPGGNSNDVPQDTGNACPESSPQGAEEDPSCGNEGNNGQGADKGDNGQGADKGNNGQGVDKGNNGNNGQGVDNGADDGNACPPTSPNAGGEPPCGEGDGAEDEDPAEEPDCENDVEHPDCQEDVAVSECTTVAENPPPPIVIEVPAQPLAYACVILFPEAEDKAACPTGALPVEVPAHPLVDACVVLGPEAPAA